MYIYEKYSCVGKFLYSWIPTYAFRCMNPRLYELCMHVETRIYERCEDSFFVKRNRNVKNITGKYFLFYFEAN